MTLPKPQELWKPAGRQANGGDYTECSLDTEDMPGTETEDEMFGLNRRRRTTVPTRTTPPEQGDSEQQDSVVLM